jgi:UDPglucose 6-dehydrogenase
MKIAIAGTGYVGLSLAILLAQNNNVYALDIDQDKVNLINNKKSPIDDEDIKKYLKTKNLKLTATTDPELAFKNSDFIIIATPTNYDVDSNKFDTSSIESVIKTVKKINTKATIVIKSTIPVGYTKSISKKFDSKNILFSPEFLREGKALHDNLHPSRIVVGEKSNRAKIFANILKEGAIKKNIPEVFTDATEAEAIKLFANTYLAMRVAYFNELDSYAYTHNLNTKEIIEGMSYDPRIGDHYNNPSFGYGGYCLPKDTKQLKANFENIPQAIVSAIIKSNELRKEFITKSIIDKKPKTVGVYRLIMKSGSDNFRESSTIEILKSLKEKGIDIVIHEPSVKEDYFMNFENIKSLERFKQKSDLIIANRISTEISDVSSKIFSRDVFGKD